MTGNLPVRLPASLQQPGLHSSLPTSLVDSQAGLQVLETASLRLGRVDKSLPLNIHIPALGLKAAVQEVPFIGKTWEVGSLDNEVGLLERTSRPGLGSNTVLAGHIAATRLGGGPFLNLHRLNPGDDLLVQTAAGTYTYQVREQWVVQPTEVSVLAASAAPQLTLVTCTGWDEESQTYTLRRVIVADLVEIDPVAQDWLGGPWID